MTLMRALVPRLAPDLTLALTALLLLATGSAMIRGVYAESGVTVPVEWLRQGVYAAIGLLAMLAVSRIDLVWLRRIAPAVYLVSLVALVVVLLIGSSEYGARRWTAIGDLATIQPSEFAKIAGSLALAAYAAEREPSIRTVITALAIAAVPAMLVLVEPDLGTALVLLGSCAIVLAAWGVPARILGGLAALGLAVLPIAFAIAVPDYQRERLAVFFDPGRDPLGSGFTLRQVEVAFAAGGLTGRGFDGLDSALAGVAPRASDFAFAQWSEFAGLTGALLVLGAFMLIAWRGFQIAGSAPDTFGRLLATGLTATIVLQAAMHVAVNTRLFPATGIPLPFISQGGSALVAVLIAAGLLQAVAAHRPPNARGTWEERWG
jgi:rod shape determining protein RodA